MHAYAHEPISMSYTLCLTASCRTHTAAIERCSVHASEILIMFFTQSAYLAVGEGRMVERERFPQDTALALEHFLGADTLAVRDTQLRK